MKNRTISRRGEASPRKEADPRGVPRRLAWLLLGLAACESATAPNPRNPVAMVLHAGDGQVAEAGTPVEAAPQVRVVGETGTGVAGVQVAFQVVEGGGSVEVPSAATGSDGVASAGRWTLGQEGPQRLEASATGLGTVVFQAGASGMPAALEVVSGDGATGEVGTRLPAAPEVRVLNDKGQPMAFVPVTFAASQGAIGTPRVFTDERGHAAAGSWTLGTRSGPQEVVAAVAGSAVEGNPAVFRALAVPSPPRRMEVAPSPSAPEAGRRYLPPPTVRITDAYGNGVPHVAVGFKVLSGGGIVGDAPSYTDETGTAVVDSWTLGRDIGDENALSVTVLSVGYDISGASAKLAVAPEEADFDLWLAYPETPETDPLVRTAMETAKTRWETAINGDVPSFFTTRNNLERCVPPDAGYDYRFRATVPFDDLMVLAIVGEVDGPGGLPGRSSWCWAANRGGTVLPTVSVVQFDEADVDVLAEIGLLDAVALHLLGHALGFGATSLWDFAELLDSDELGPVFTGRLATTLFDIVGGTAYDGPKVPLDEAVTPQAMHWRGSVFGLELMSLAFAPDDNPLSLVTLGALVDMGYRGVSSRAADEYVLPEPAGPSAASAALAARFHFHGDGLPVTRRIVDASGAVIRVFEPDNPEGGSP